MTLATLKPATPLPLTLVPLSPVKVYRRCLRYVTWSRWWPNALVPRQVAPFGLVLPGRHHEPRPDRQALAGA